jgi:hypothetical protein
MEAPSLKSAQLAAVHRMLSLNDTNTTKASSPSSSFSYNDAPAGTSYNQWKILIYDIPCRSIISPLLSVSQLRSRGVTLHLLISSTTEREAIPDVPAVYFVEPTRSNLKTIAEDCAKRLYSKVHINFVTKLDRALMEEFGKLMVQNGCLDMIASLHDQYLDFICLEKNLFSLSNQKDSYAMINGSGVTDMVMENYLTDLAFGLLSVVGTTGCVPVIRCPRGGAPEMVARKLNKLIAEHPSTGANYNHSHHSKHMRPLLVILDRNMELITPIQHSSTYQALIDDLLTHQANRVEFTTKAEGGVRSQVKKFDLDADLDTFYQRHKFNPFPEAIESNGVELNNVTSREKAIRSKTVGGNADDNVDATATANAVSHQEDGMAASDLASAVDSLPKLLEQKKQLEMHTSILQAVMNEVAARDVPQFYELESALASGQYKNDPLKAKNAVMALAIDVSKGNVEDKIRLVIVFCLATTAPGSDVTEVASAMANALESKGTTHTASGGGKGAAHGHGLLSKDDRIKLDKGLKAIAYLKNLRSMQMIPNIADAVDYGSRTAGNSDLLSGFMARATNQATGLLAKATEKVSSMLGKIVKHYSTRVVENLCEMKPGTEDDEYLYLDPKVKGDVDVKILRNMTRSPCREVITFVIGGGCYAEYQNLQMIADERRSVTYGSTELMSPCEFLSQLGKLS